MPATSLSEIMASLSRIFYFGPSSKALIQKRKARRSGPPKNE
jgi:hypothetical protein